MAFATLQYMSLGRAKASNCVQCGKCEQHCPQHISIREELKNVKATFEQNL
ncbi:hypothetical protein CLMAG_42040 [Clostridium magnum DSM 2767]|uniref:4Fe-4S ferredoxin-type domain-containing protein n=1 Tax=Clostridium magnum DSM 2767 TaxID=1121326 RepID=A0A162RVJ2_9CLOT|nr:hypothetical protein CLMAG_42040 [Clostridium magnum DSM 2767]SHH85024.1 4Fe-4S dicluster domain-containing protein [Clostridium magnum DSM 2767]